MFDIVRCKKVISTGIVNKMYFFKFQGTFPKCIKWTEVEKSAETCF